jgi:hypothetical protein
MYITPRSINQDRACKMEKYIITKRIAKHGSQSIIVIPRLLEKDLKPGIVARVTIDVLREGE